MDVERRRKRERSKNKWLNVIKSDTNNAGVCIDGMAGGVVPRKKEDGGDGK